jgi:Tfp pilus assembly protein PilE
LSFYLVYNVDAYLLINKNIMGQQQLLLVILVSIIVGIATIVALNAFGNSAISANRDAVRQDMLMIASAAQAWYIMPEMMGGGSNSFANLTFHDFTFPAESINTNGNIAVNLNGLYIIDPAAGTSFTITAHPASDPNYNPDDAFSATATETMVATVTKGGITWAS